MRHARILPFIVCTLLLAAPPVWPVETKPAPRASIAETRVIIPEIKASFTIPSQWPAEFFRTQPEQIAQLSKDATGEWDSAYGPVADSVLQLSDCVCHLGGEGWGAKSYSFADIQMRAYLTNTKPEDLQKALVSKGTQAATGAKGTKVKTDSKTDGDWTLSHISFDLWYIDYGGTANIYFYSRPVGERYVVLAFMMIDSAKNFADRDAIVKSLAIEAPKSK